MENSFHCVLNLGNEIATTFCTWHDSPLSWWRHRLETFSALLTLCEGNPSDTSGFTSQRPVRRSFDVFFDLLLKPTVEQTIETPVIWDAIRIPLIIMVAYCTECYHRCPGACQISKRYEHFNTQSCRFETFRDLKKISMRCWMGQVLY